MSQLKRAVDVSEPLSIIDRLLVAAFSPTRRDRQAVVGPSGVGDPCDHCLAVLLSHKLTGGSSGNGNLATWIGTAMHEYLEKLLPDHPDLSGMGLIAEQKIFCGEIEGYGPVYGSPDLFVTEGGVLIDWKSSTKKRIASYKLHGQPTVYNYQGDTYGDGLTLAGHRVNWVVNVFIPRDGSKFSDVWSNPRPFVPGGSKAAFDRASTIYNEFVVPGRIDELGSDDDCFQCNVAPYLQQTRKLVFNNGED